jgi:hypothetical protein
LAQVPDADADADVDVDVDAIKRAGERLEDNSV